jgi:hypothetical protein
MCIYSSHEQYLMTWTASQAGKIVCHYIGSNIYISLVSILHKTNSLYIRYINRLDHCRIQNHNKISRKERRDLRAVEPWGQHELVFLLLRICYRARTGVNRFKIHKKN